MNEVKTETNNRQNTVKEQTWRNIFRGTSLKELCVVILLSNNHCELGNINLAKMLESLRKQKFKKFKIVKTKRKLPLLLAGPRKIATHAACSKSSSNVPQEEILYKLSG